MGVAGVGNGGMKEGWGVGTGYGAGCIAGDGIQYGMEGGASPGF